MNPTRPTLRTIVYRYPDTHTALLYYLRVTSEDRASKGARRAAVRGKGNARGHPRARFENRVTYTVLAVETQQKPTAAYSYSSVNVNAPQPIPPAAAP